MKVAAVECLGTSADDLVYLLEQAKAKAKDVRAAALRALSAAGVRSADVLTALKKAIAGADLELIIQRVKECSLPEIQDYVLDQAEEQFAALLKSMDKKEQGLAVLRLQRLVACLEDRTDARAEAFLLKCFENANAFAAIKSEPAGSDLNELVAHVMSHGTPKLQKRLVAAHKTLTGGMISPAIFAARAILSPADFYKEFSPLLKNMSEKRGKKSSGDHDRGIALGVAIRASGATEPYIYRPWMATSRYARHHRETPMPALDPRWLDAAVEAGLLDLVCELARPGHAATNRFLSEQLAEKKKEHESQEILRTMVRIGHPDAVDVLIEGLKQRAKDTYFSYSYWYGRMIVELPKSALPKLDALLPTLPDKMVDQLMESILELKNKPE